MRKILQKILLLLIASNFLPAMKGQAGTTSVSSPMENIKKIYPAAPTANNLMKFEEVPVSYYTGIPDIKIPIANIPTNDSKISMNVSLNYHPLNAKPIDKSGEEGLGWSLFAGGSITRTVRGGPDDGILIGSAGSQETIGIYYDEYNYLNGATNYARKYLDELTTIGSAFHTEQYKKLLFEALFFNRYDTEYDLYQYNFMGFTGRFIIKKNQANNLYVEKLDKNNLHIEISSTNPSKSLEVWAFVITDDSGNKFTFDVRELSQRSMLSNKIGFYGNYNTNTSNLGDIISAFHLSKVTTSSNVDLIKLDYYPPYEIFYTDNSHISRNKSAYDVNEQEVMAFDSQIPASDETNAVTSVTSQRNLKEIEILGKGKISFSYLQGRADTDYTNPQQLMRLDKVKMINPSGNVLETYEFSYGYFNYRLFAGNLNMKLALKKITKYNKDLVKDFDYTLDYNDNAETNILGLDHWEWFNCVRPNTNTLFARHVSPKCTAINVLKSIKLPSGGLQSFDFGSNTYSFDQNGTAITNFDDNTENWTYSESTNINLQSNGLNDAFYLLGKSPQARILIIENSQVLNDDNDIGFLVLEKLDFSDQVMQSIGIKNIQYNQNNEITLDAGYRYRIRFTWTNMGQQGNAFITFAYKSRTPVQKQWLNGGGVRINSISYYDNPSEVIPDKKVVFSYNRFTDSNSSSGALVFLKPIHSYAYNYHNNFAQKCSFASPFTCTLSYANLFTVYSSQNLLPAQKTQGSDVGYQNISVYEVGKGKTDYIFTSPIDKPNPEYLSYTNPPFPALDNYDYKRGLLLQDEKKNNTNVLLSKKTNQYNSYQSEILTGINLSYINSPFSEYLYAGQVSPNLTPVPLYEDYDTYCIQSSAINAYCGDRTNVSSMIRIVKNREIIGKANPNHSESTEYFNGKTLKTIEDITFNTRDYPTKQVTTHSDSKITETNYQYAHEKANQRLINANMIGVPLETSIVQKDNPADAGSITAKSETRYDNGSNLYPSSALSFDILSGAPSTEVKYDLYDEKGNLLQYTNKEDVPVAIIWGYNKTQPVAKIEGATYAQVQDYVSAIVNASDADAVMNPNADESSLLTILDAFRTNSTLAPFQITTFTYDPIIGVRSITPPSGLREKYIYDSANRLKEIQQQQKDASGNLVYKKVKEFNYNYKN